MLPTGVAFENPEWLQALWGLPLIVLLYLIRKRARRVLVPFLPFWQRVFAERRRQPSLLRTLISILLQMLAATAAIVALARPYRETSVAEPVRSVVIVDRGLATAMAPDGVPLADRAAARGHEVFVRASSAGPTTVAVLRSGLEPRSAGAAAFEGLPAPAGSRPLEEIATLRAASDPATRIFFVTPFAVDPKLLAGVTVIAAAPGPLANGGIRSVALDAARGELAVRADPGGTARTLFLRAADGSTLASAPVSEPAPVVLKVPDDAPPDAELRLEPPDGFPADDLAPLDLPDRGRLKVVVASDAPTPALDSALLASSIMDEKSSGRVALGDLAKVVEEFDVAIVVGAPDGTALPAGSYFLADSFPQGMPATVGAGEAEARATKRRADVPWLKALDVDEWRVHRMRPVEGLAGLDVLVEGTRGPLVARFEQGGVRAIALSVRPELAASTLPLIPAFPLMLRGALLELAPRSRTPGPPVHRAGDRIVLAPAEAAAVVAGDGSPRPLRLARDGGGYELPSAPGRYAAGGRTITVAWLDHPALPGAARVEDDPWPAAPRRPERRSFQPELLLLLIAVLLAEWCSYHFGATD
jgi:hypothetical protein